MSTIDTSPKVSRRLILECNHTQPTISKYKMVEAQGFVGIHIYCSKCKAEKRIVRVN